VVNSVASIANIVKNDRMTLPGTLPSV